MKLNIRKRNNKPSIIVEPTKEQIIKLASLKMIPEDVECIDCQDNPKCDHRYLPYNVGKCLAADALEVR